MRHPIRLIDAAANRAIEAARVLEDLARFCVGDIALTDGFKSVRHDLVSLLAALPSGLREAHRDLAGDVGTGLQGANEMVRANIAAICGANGSRLTEALRSIEEVLKVLPDSQAHSAAIESLRYRAYELNARLAMRVQSSAARQWKVCLLLTVGVCRHDWRRVLAESLAAGVDCIQVREKEFSSARLVDHVREVLAIADPHRACVIVNDRIDVALAAGAHGVHLGLDDLTIPDAHRIAGKSLIIGATVHSLIEAQEAIDAGADYCGVGPMFASALKPGLAAAGPSWIEEFVGRWPRQLHLAIGGINSANAGQLARVGCRGVAVSSALCDSSDPGAEASKLCEIFA